MRKTIRLNCNFSFIPFRVRNFREESYNPDVSEYPRINGENSVVSSIKRFFIVLKVFLCKYVIMIRKLVFLTITILTYTSGLSTAIAVEATPPTRLCVSSPWYSVCENDLELFASYSWFDPTRQKRFYKLTIGDKVLEMIRNAKKFVIASVFLFDCFYSETKIERDIVAELTEAMILQKKKYPDMTAVLILDPINKGYGNRVSPAVKKLTENGVDVFYSDLLPTKSATKIGIAEFMRESFRFIDDKTFRIPGRVLSIFNRIKLPIDNSIDSKGISIEMIWMASALKANHRKIIVTDTPDNQYETLISTGNPHNASIPSTNFAVSVKGDIGKYIYMVLREDALHSASLNDVIFSDKSKRYAKSFFKDKFSALNLSPVADTNMNKPVAVSFITEGKIKDTIIETLRCARPNDQVRIQMFYLSEPEIIEEIIKTARRVNNPIKIILDPNKDAFNRIKDGTPNRQVAAYLMQKKKKLGLKLKIRWYDTHGEQNHAKMMSITNAKENKYQLLTGSCNWTGKNLNDINMESDIFVKGSKKLATQFNDLFDRFWTNSDGMIYTIQYEGKYQKHAGMSKWLNGEKWGYVSW